ncbi:MAG TPA: acyltransferase family protein, partial [Acidimicrobiales bacterium]|nr:acyltransferase family protein [Acidimicrobiales bacterium]
NRAALLAARRRGDPWPVYLVSRTARLVRPVVPLAMAGVLTAATLPALGVDAGSVHTLAKVVAQPLWFLAVYLVVMAATPALLAAHERSPRRVLALLAIAVVAVDGLRLRGWASWTWSANYAFVFLLVSELGLLLADGTLPSWPRRRVAMLGVAALALLVVLVAGPYPTSMVGVPGERVSNMSPPTVCIALLAVVQATIATLLRPRLARLLQDARRWRAVIAANSIVMTVFLWHLPALAVVAGVILPLGLPQPAPGAGEWWLLRPAWIALTIAVLAVAVAGARRFERVRPLPSRRGAVAALAAFGLATTAMTVLALDGLGGGSGVAGAGLALAAARVATGPRTRERRRPKPAPLANQPAAVVRPEP